MRLDTLGRMLGSALPSTIMTTLQQTVDMSPSATTSPSALAPRQTADLITPVVQASSTPATESYTSTQTLYVVVNPSETVTQANDPMVVTMTQSPLPPPPSIQGVIIIVTQTKDIRTTLIDGHTYTYRVEPTPSPAPTPTSTSMPVPEPITTTVSGQLYTFVPLTTTA